MPCGAPLTKHDEPRLQVFLEEMGVSAQPGTEASELAAVGQLQVVATVLRARLAVAAEREAEIGAVKFLFHHHFTFQQLLDLRAREQLVVARQAFAQPGEMGCVRKAEKNVGLAHRNTVRSGSSGSAWSGNLLR